MGCASSHPAPSHSGSATCSRAQDQETLRHVVDTQKCINMEIRVGHQVSGIKNVHEKYLEPHKSKHQAKREEKEKEKEMAPPPPNQPGQSWDGSPTGLWLGLGSPGSGIPHALAEPSSKGWLGRGQGISALPLNRQGLLGSWPLETHQAIRRWPRVYTHT